MLTEEQALRIWREIAPLDASIERVRLQADGDPPTFRVLVPTKPLGGNQLKGVVMDANACSPKGSPPSISSTIRDDAPFLEIR